MRTMRLLGLLPIAIGVAMIIVGGTHAAEVEPSLCRLLQSMAAVPEACFFGVPVALVYGLPAALLLGIGLAMLAWPQVGANAARLAVNAPRLHQYPPHRSDTTSFCRVRVHNRGPAAADNVQMWLINIEPAPRHASWAADYPYPVVRAGQVIGDQSCRIGRGGDELFQVASGWKNTRGEFLTGLDTKSKFHNPTPIAADERWNLLYRVTADNAEPVCFGIEVSIENGEVAIKRGNWRAIGQASGIASSLRRAAMI
jgi:hypothetical protein